MRQATIAPHGAPTTAKIIDVATGSATASETTQFVDDASASRSICLGLKVRKGQNEKGEKYCFRAVRHCDRGQLRSSADLSPYSYPILEEPQVEDFPGGHGGGKDQVIALELFPRPASERRVLAYASIVLPARRQVQRKSRRPTRAASNGDTYSEASRKTVSETVLVQLPLQDLAPFNITVLLHWRIATTVSPLSLS